ncbi:4Fe-4S binding protein [Pectobacterium brasiliense]|uniref:4Fe-4S dicluster domain-containing protein n=1 Tax=Pectobacterium TaxID=122277 RepID=UPI0019691826|nr:MULTISPECIES: 4Fe-4S dicluster domain-containing protein [Pectobacterium]MBN3190817.1 4Fe-4S binding protein [Pectobacterium brasiliense]MCL6329126.1 4Fe-4S dicluster domain-containing protein [Pectobacterium carotovorum subsp. carotovorum]
MEKDARYYRGYLSHRYVSRRGLFRAFLNASRHNEPQPDSIQPRAPLPPGALSASQFYQHCDRCQQCVGACPMGVLIVNEEGYPQLVIEYASCDGCQACVSHCLSGALLPQAHFDTGLRPTVGTTCISVPRHCRSCIEACPVQALSLSERGLPEVDSARCHGCGECLIQCETQAISLISFA